MIMREAFFHSHRAPSDTLIPQRSCALPRCARVYAVHTHVDNARVFVVFEWEDSSIRRPNYGCPLIYKSGSG